MWDEARTRETYDEVADTYADHVCGTEPEQAPELGMLDHFVALLGGDARVLDAGCGAGRMTPYLAARGCRVDGVDLSPEMVRRARADHPSFPTQVASMTSLPFDDGTFDGVMSWYSTIHSDDQELDRALGECWRVLRPAGLLILAFQTGNGVRDVAAGYRSLGHDVVLMRHGRPLAWVTQRAVAAGFRVVAGMEREAVNGELDGQAALIVRAPGDASAQVCG